MEINLKINNIGTANGTSAWLSQTLKECTVEFSHTRYSHRPGLYLSNASGERQLMVYFKDGKAFELAEVVNRNDPDSFRSIDGNWYLCSLFGVQLTDFAAKHLYNEVISNLKTKLLLIIAEQDNDSISLKVGE